MSYSDSAEEFREAKRAGAEEERAAVVAEIRRRVERLDRFGDDVLCMVALHMDCLLDDIERGDHRADVARGVRTKTK